MRRRSGFTLVEVMAASLLAGMLFLAAVPFFALGKRSIRQISEKEAAWMIGDSAFEAAKEELMYAERVCFGEPDRERAVVWTEEIERGPASDAAWTEEIEVRSASDATPMGAGLEVNAEGMGEWKRIGDDFSWEDMELTTETRAAGPDRLELTMRLWEADRCVYERTETIPLLNLTLGGNRLEEGESAADVWYQ